jgi:hypothetical protein
MLLPIAALNASAKSIAGEDATAPMQRISISETKLSKKL